jgi:hypothetical protein
VIPHCEQSFGTHTVSRGPCGEGRAVARPALKRC